jgi:hypothetical protein
MRTLAFFAIGLCLNLVGCNSTRTGISEHSTFDNAPPNRRSLAIEQRGFAPIKRELTLPTAWEVSTFAMRSKQTTWFRARQPMRNQPNTYYCRFRLFEESFNSEFDAKARLARIRDVAPNEHVEEKQISALRSGFRVGTNIYILGTDAAIFNPVVFQLATELASAIPGAVAEARRTQALPN